MVLGQRVGAASARALDCVAIDDGEFHAGAPAEAVAAFAETGFLLSPLQASFEVCFFIRISTIHGVHGPLTLAPNH